ncbi:MAG: hypothetical protein L3J79_00790 [Candidatus Marinimicrobia bacterium]|nr:hypothetical protein [Candidatus Neomarinimicrobiota bacterium]
MLSKLLRILLISIVLTFQVWGQTTQLASSKPSVLKSALLPGWGEHSYNSAIRGYLFNGVEAALWIFSGIAYSTAISHENDLYYFASEYGQISDPHQRSDAFLDRVSKYDNMDEYNEQMLRNRQWDRVYSAENGEYWDWESLEKRQEYFKIKTQRYLWRQRLTYSFGAIALNHLVSTMDALYLKRSHTSLTVQPEIGNGSTGMRLQFSF